MLSSVARSGAYTVSRHVSQRTGGRRCHRPRRSTPGIRPRAEGTSAPVTARAAGAEGALVASQVPATASSCWRKRLLARSNQHNAAVGEAGGHSRPGTAVWTSRRTPGSRVSPSLEFSTALAQQPARHHKLDLLGAFTCPGSPGDACTPARTYPTSLLTRARLQYRRVPRRITSSGGHASVSRVVVTSSQARSRLRRVRCPTRTRRQHHPVKS